MDELDREAERMLAAFRAADTFGAERQRHVRRRLARSVSRPAPRWLDELERPQGPPRRATSPRVWWWGAAAAVILALAAVAGGRDRAQRDDASAASQASDRATHRDSGGSVRTSERGGGVASERDTSPRLPAEDGIADDPTSEPTPAVPPSPSPSPSRSVRQPKPEAPRPKTQDSELRLRLELERIDRIDAALRRGDVGAASRALSEYDRDFPRGQLREESRGLRVLLACQRSVAGASEDAARYLRLHPRSMLEGRIEQACRDAKKNSIEATDSRPPVQSPIDETP